MSTLQRITVVPSTIGGQAAQLVDARQLHAFLGVSRDFSTWIKNRIEEYEFEEDRDFIIFDSPKWGNQTGRGGNRRSIDYFLTLDMAKELAMVERTPQGRQARRYFIECERQWQQMRQLLQAANTTDLSRAERRAINRQAWADVAGQATATFHARREEILIGYAQQKKSLTAPPADGRPSWARED